MKHLRLYFGLTLEDVAKAAGVTKQCVSQYEKGRFNNSRLDAIYNGESFEQIRREKYGDLMVAIDRKDYHL